VSFITFGLIKEKYVGFVCKLDVLSSTSLTYFGLVIDLCFLLLDVAGCLHFCFWFSVKVVIHARNWCIILLVKKEDADCWSANLNASSVPSLSLLWKLVPSSHLSVFFMTANVAQIIVP
jgi:hypothetical protein